MKFYKYLIYRLYSWRLKANDKNPEAAVIFSMVAVHIFQLYIVYMIILKFAHPIGPIHTPKTIIYGVYILTALFYYIVVYNKKRWLGYIERFQDEGDYGWGLGTILILLFTIGTFVLFFSLLPILF